MKKIIFTTEQKNELFQSCLANGTKHGYAYASLHEQVNNNIYHIGFTEFSPNVYHEIAHFTGYTLSIDERFFNSVDKEYFLNKIRPYYLKIENKSVVYKSDWDVITYYNFALLIDDEKALELALEFHLDIKLETIRFNGDSKFDNNLRDEYRKYSSGLKGEYFGLRL